MSKLETAEGKQTNWCGLWYHREYNGYSSPSINLAQLKKFKGTVRLYVRKNKQFDKESNRPNMVFCLKDSKSEMFTNIEFVEERKDYIDRIEELGELYTRKDVQRAINEAAEWGMRGYGSGHHVVEDFIAPSVIDGEIVER